MQDTEEHNTLQKLKKLLDDKDLHLFDSREVETIRRMISTYQSFESFGRLSNGVRSVVVWLAVMLGAYFAFMEWVVKFIRAKAGTP